MFRSPIKAISSKRKKFLFIRPGGIGDAVLLLPAIKALKTYFHDSDIDVLCEKRNAEIFTLSNEINRSYLYDRGFDLLKCFKNKYDAVIDTEQWHRLSAVVAYLTGAGIRIGFDTNERRRLLTHRIPYNHDDYEGYSFLHLMEPLIGAVSEFKADTPFIDTGDDFPIHVLPASLKGNNKVIAVFPGASVKERLWGVDNFGKTAKALKNMGYEIIILGAKNDRRDAGAVIKHAGDCIDLTGKTNLKDAANVLKICRLLITSDSGLMHIAYAVGTPTISFFGAGIEKKWAPRGNRHIALNKLLDCSPCTKFGYMPKCKKGIKCLSSISADEVLKAAESILPSR
jgi:ADP-heptose:LPS heptosyltransferase